MSRRELLKLIAFSAVIIAVVCLAAICLIPHVNEKGVSPDDPSLSRLGILEKDGLSIVSHGVEITAENETAVIELIEQFVQENYDNWMAVGYIEVRGAARDGVAIEIHYNPARELICPPMYDSRLNATVQLDRIYVTIPDFPSKQNHRYYYVSPIRDGDLDHTIILPIEKANEILKLIGEDPIPPGFRFRDKLPW